MFLINLGLPKSGTTTLHLALNRSGYSSVHWKHRGQIVGEKVYENYFDSLNPLKGFLKKDAMTQLDYITRTQNFWPQINQGLIRQVHEFNVNFKFILLR